MNNNPDRTASQGGEKQRIDSALAAGDDRALLALARSHTQRVLRHLSGRLYSSDEGEKWRAVRALGIVAGLVDETKLVELLRRYVWALNDESGAVPYGIPEAIGEILVARPEFQPAFLPILCSLLTEQEMAQTGPIERGAVWAIGRVGPPVAIHSPETVAVLSRMAQSHADPSTRRLAARSYAGIIGEGGVEPDESPD